MRFIVNRGLSRVVTFRFSCKMLPPGDQPEGQRPATVSGLTDMNPNAIYNGVMHARFQRDWNNITVIG